MTLSPYSVQLGRNILPLLAPSVLARVHFLFCLRAFLQKGASSLALSRKLGGRGRLRALLLIAVLATSSGKRHDTRGIRATSLEL